MSRTGGPGQSDWIKTLLLFFDGVAVLVPDYMHDRLLFTDPTLAQPLADQGLLHQLSPEMLIDQSVTEGSPIFLIGSSGREHSMGYALTQRSRNSLILG
jgi:hypothetical protein